MIFLLQYSDYCMFYVNDYDNLGKLKNMFLSRSFQYVLLPSYLGNAGTRNIGIAKFF